MELDGRPAFAEQVSYFPENLVRDVTIRITDQDLRSYTMGQAWWVADCGPFWGHNALVRVRPFMVHCELPLLPGKPPLGGPILSHDQVEAVMMRKAGYEVRVLPYEIGSWEENPPTMIDFAKRDVRWCQGNMQYASLLGLPGLLPLSRFQLAWAMLMFIGIPAWTLMIALLPVAAYEARAISDYPAGLAVGLYVAFFTMYRAQYRWFGDNARVVLNTTVDAGSNRAGAVARSFDPSARLVVERVGIRREDPDRALDRSRVGDGVPVGDPDARLTERLDGALVVDARGHQRHAAAVGADGALVDDRARAALPLAVAVPAQLLGATQEQLGVSGAVGMGVAFSRSK